MFSGIATPYSTILKCDSCAIQSTERKISNSPFYDTSTVKFGYRHNNHNSQHSAMSSVWCTEYGVRRLNNSRQRQLLVQTKAPGSAKYDFRSASMTTRQFGSRKRVYISHRPEPGLSPEFCPLRVDLQLRINQTLKVRM